MKRVLIITYYWPPTGGSGVQRWVKFAKYLPQFGWQPVIYTPENPEQLARDESLVADIPEGTEIIKTRIFEPYEIYRKFKGKKEVNPINAQKKSWKQKLAVWIRGNLFIPDPRIGWVQPSVKFLKEYLKEHPVDAVVTTGPPQSMHLIGRGLKRATGIRWIADFRDPWTKLFYFKHLGLTKHSEKLHGKLERSVLDECDLIISVSPLVRTDFKEATQTPVELITNGYDTEDFGLEEYHRGEFFTIVHTGMLASDGNPVNLWDVLSQKCSEEPEFRKKLQLRLSGKVDSEVIQAIVERGLGENLVNLGYLPHTEITGEQRKASLLILPLRQEPESKKIVPGKIFEYLASKRPVLGIGQEDGAAASILEDSKAGQIFDWDKRNEVKDFINHEWENYLQDAPASSESRDIDKYSRFELTRKLTKFL